MSAFECPHCNVYVSFIAPDRWTYPFKRRGFGHTNKVLICPNCFDFTVVTTDTFSSNIVKIYPNAKPKQVPDYTPNFIKKDIEEIYKCISMDCYESVAMLGRRVLEKICNATLELKGKDKRKTVATKVNLLLKEGWITKRVSDIASNIRWAGTDAIHDNEVKTDADTETDETVVIDKQTANNIIILLDHIIQSIYELDEVTNEVNAKHGRNK